MEHCVVWSLPLFCAIAIAALAMGLPSLAAGVALAVLCVTSLVAVALGALVISAWLNGKRPDPFADPD